MTPEEFALLTVAEQAEAVANGTYVPVTPTPAPSKPVMNTDPSQSIGTKINAPKTEVRKVILRDISEVIASKGTEFHMLSLQDKKGNVYALPCNAKFVKRNEAKLVTGNALEITVDTQVANTTEYVDVDGSTKKHTKDGQSISNILLASNDDIEELRLDRIQGRLRTTLVENPALAGLMAQVFAGQR